MGRKDPKGVGPGTIRNGQQPERLARASRPLRYHAGRLAALEARGHNQGFRCRAVHYSDVDQPNKRYRRTHG